MTTPAEFFETRLAQLYAHPYYQQIQFAQLLGISVRTLQEWEQGRRQLSAAAKTLLRVAENHPKYLRELA